TDLQRTLVGGLVLMPVGEQDAEARAAALRPRRNTARPAGHQFVIARQDRVPGRPEAVGDIAVEAIEAIVFGQGPPGQPREVALEDVPEEDDLVVLALEVVQE